MHLLAWHVLLLLLCQVSTCLWLVFCIALVHSMNDSHEGFEGSEALFMHLNKSVGPECHLLPVEHQVDVI